MNKPLTDDLFQRCRELLELKEKGQHEQHALRALAEAYDHEIPYHIRRSMAESQTHVEAMQALLATQQPEPREAILYEHDDGRYAVVPSAEVAHFTRDEPAWHRVGPVTVYGSQPEPRVEVTSVQWWLAELDQYGNPKLSDGAHSERAGADKAMYLIKNLGLDNKGKRWAVARVELSEPRPSADGVNHDAVSACRAMVDAARAGDAS